MARAVATNGERFVAVGNNGIFDGEGEDDGAAWWSPDGLTWTRASPGPLSGPEGQYIA